MHHLRLLRQMFEHAITWGRLKKNVAKQIRMPKIPKKEMDALSPSEVRAFLNGIPEKWQALFLVAISTGLRIGEIIAMRWENLDWRSGQYFVKETWLRPREGRKASFGPPKSEASIAPVDLIPEALDALRIHGTRQKEQRLEKGEKWEDNGLIFTTRIGRPLADKNITRYVFVPALEDAGLRKIRFHDLRHTTASLLIHNNESPKYIQKQMRHSSIEITFDRYGHLFPGENKEAANRLGALIRTGVNSRAAV